MSASLGSQVLFSQMSSIYCDLAKGFGESSETEEAPLPKSLLPQLSATSRLLHAFTTKLSQAMTLAELMLLMPDLVKSHLPAELAPLLDRTVSRWNIRPYNADAMSPSFFFSATTSRASIAYYYNNYELEEHQTGDRRPDETLYTIVMALFSNRKLMSQLPSFKRLKLIESQKMLKAVSLFLQNALKNMTVSPQQEMMSDVKLEKMYHFNQWAKEEIQIIERRVQAQNMSSKVNEAMRDQLIAKLRQELVQLQELCRKRIDLNREKKEEQMIWELKVSEHTQDELSTMIKKLERELAELKEHNQEVEDEGRIRRHKTEQQLRTILKKFDEDVFARQKLYTRVDLEHKEELEQMRQLQEKFDEQNIEYTALYEEKMAYEASVRQAALKEIYKRIAARIIQRFYRYYVMMCNRHGVKRFDIKRKKKGKKK